METNLLQRVKRAVARRKFDDLFKVIQSECRTEIELINNTQNRFIESLIQPNAPITIVASLYKDIATVVRQAIDSKMLSLSYDQGVILDTVSLVYISSLTNKCAVPNWTRSIDFVIKNGKHLAFWQWFRAHLPHHMKFLGFATYSYPLDFVLPSIIRSNPNDLHYYKVLCRELKKRMPETYEHYKIESPVCKALVQRLKQIELGQEPPRQAFPAHLAKNNLLILDILR
jgi:hypothetical protein